MNPAIHSVFDVVHYLKQTLDHDPQLQTLLVKGEVSNFTNHRSGHWYFTLKDRKAKISCVMFSSYASRCKLLLKEGMQVIVSASLSMYETGGSLQLYVTKVQVDGLGDLYLQLEQVKQQMLQEGLFAPSRKQPLPLYPMRIAVVTARTGAAIQDILTTIARRWPICEVQVYPCLVQGSQAADDIITALQQAEQGHYDVILLARGGGAIEDLWCFNEERVARCIAAMNSVVVTGVGHESDTTLVDYVSDARAATPTAAAELITPDRQEVLSTLTHVKQRMQQQIHTRLAKEKAAFQPLRQHRYMVEPLSYIRESQMKLAIHVQEMSVVERQLQTLRHSLQSQKQQFSSIAQQLHNRQQQQLEQQRLQLRQAMTQYQHEAKQSMASHIQLLDAFSPLQILKRGYSLVEQEGKLIKSIDEVSCEDSLRIRMKDGFLMTEVKKKERL